MPEMTPEQLKENLLDALCGARTDWLEADTELERDIHMAAIDSILDAGIRIGAFALRGAMNEATSD